MRQCLNDAEVAALLSDAAASARTDALEHLAECARCSALVADVFDVSRSSRTASPELEQLPRGTTLGRYVVLDRLGAGAMGSVYAALDSVLERKVALKLLRGASSDALLDEARAMAKLSHPNVVPIHEVAEVDGTAFIVMEFAARGTVKRWVEQAQPGWREIVRIFVDAGRGLAHAHDAGIVHRDFKPDNVLISADGRGLVADFGLGAVAGIATDIAGTPAYLAPEAFAKVHRPGPAADQFSFCVALYEALTGQRPWSAPSLAQLVQAVRRGPPARSRIPRSAWQVLRRGLAAEPQQRFASMHDLVRELERVSARTGRVGVMTATAVTLAALAGVGVRWSNECSGGALDEVWNEAVRARVSQGLRATRGDFVAETERETLAALDSYAARAKAMHQDICRGRGEPAELNALRRSCLTIRQTALQTLADSLSSANQVAAELAVEAASGLPRLEDCADSVYLLNPVAAPSAPTLRAAILEARTSAARAKTLTAIGQSEAASAAAEASLAQALDAGFGPAVAESRFARADALFSRDDYPRAAEEFERAVWAAEASNHVAITIEASASLVRLSALGGHFEEGARWGRLGQAALERLGSPTLSRATVVGAMGFLREREGNYELADALHEDVVRLLETRLPADDVWVLNSRLHHVASLRRLHRLDEAQAQVDLVARALEARLGPTHPLWIEVLSARANVAGDAQRPQDAIADHRRVIALLDALRGPANFRKAVALTNLAAQLSIVGAWDDALAAAEEALAIKRATFDATNPSVLMTRETRATLLARVGRRTEALAELRDVLTGRRAVLPAEHPDIAMTLSNIGMMQRESGHFEDSLAAHREALALEEKALGPKHPDLAWDLAGVGEALLLLGRPRDALPPLERALVVGESQPADFLAIVRFSLARANFALNVDRARAIEWVRAAEVTLTKSPEKERLTEVRKWLREVAPK